jgi:hypothetical protein
MEEKNTIKLQLALNLLYESGHSDKYTKEAMEYITDVLNSE